MESAITYSAVNLGLPRRILGAVLAGLILTAGHVRGEPNEVELREGANISITSSAGGDRIAFDLINRIWIIDPKIGIARQLTTDDEVARRPALSPDGRLVAYETIRDGYNQIMVRDADGSRPRQITFGEFNHRAPMWSPQPNAGNRLVMSSDRSGNFGIWEIDIDTLDLQQLTFESGNEREPAWNADGSELAYVSDTEHGMAIYAVRPGASPRQLLEESTPIHAPSWRPDGGVLTYVREEQGRFQLRMLIQSTPTITKPITIDEDVFPFPAHWINRSEFRYTADGHIRQRRFGERGTKDIAFSARVALPADRRSGNPLPENSQVRPSNLDNDLENRAVIGTNGRSATRDGRYFVSALSDLWEISDTGQLRRQVTSDPYVDAHPALSPDGKYLAYISDRSGNLQVWLRDLATQVDQRLTHAEGIALYPVFTDDGLAVEFFTAHYAAASELARNRVTIATRSNERLDTITRNDLPQTPESIAEDTPLPLTWRPFRTSGRTIVRAGRIFDGLGPGYLTEHEIVIEGDRIVEVRPWTFDSDADTRMIDARDQTVIPGLIDLSTHQGLLGDERVGRQWLAYGVTTIRESVRDVSEAIARRESWQSGRRIGPRLALTHDPCTEAPPGLVARPVLEPAVERRYLQTRIAQAAELASASVGLCASLNATARIDMIALAHASGLSVRTSNPFPDLLLGADETRLPPAGSSGYSDFPVVAGTLNASVTSNLSAAGLPELVTRGELPGGWQYRTLFTNAERDAYTGTWNISAAEREVGHAASLAARLSLLNAAGRGAHVVTGSDAPLTPPGLGLHGELRLLAQSGLQAFQVLHMATLAASRVLGEGRQLGAIRAGYLADMLIIDGDPLADLHDVENIAVTMVGGRAYTRQELSLPGSRPTDVGNLYN